MQATLSAGDKPPGLRAGVQQAIAATANDSETAVELELLSILEGPAFRGSPRSRVFLQFVVEEALAGRHDSLKERTVGVAVLGKRADYDTGADSGVRVRANDVRKRLAAHYEAVAPRAGIRIELPVGAYAPRFVAAPRQPASLEPRNDQPSPMLLWQLAAPTLFAAFLALMAIRGGVESSDAFSRFWNQAMAGRTEIAIAVDAGMTAPDGASISPAMADAAMPFEALADALEKPVHIVAAGSEIVSAKDCVIRLSLTEKPPERAAFLLSGASVFRGRAGQPAIWLWAKNAETLRSAATILSSRSAFPEIP